MKKINRTLVFVFLALLFLTSCGEKKDSVVIYTSSDENEIEIMRELLDSKFPDVNISIEYYGTGDHAAKLKAEGLDTECDISYDLELGYMQTLDELNIFADLSFIDTSIFIDDLLYSKNYIPTLRYGGAIVVNTEVLKNNNLDIPSSYYDLLKPEYKNLVSMPNPKASATGYMFYKSLVNAWGEEKAIDYFEKLSNNIAQFTSSGSGPVNALVSKEAAIGFGMTSHAALKISEGNPLKILFFEEGSPYAACGAAIIKGKETDDIVKEVFEYIYEEVSPKICEKLYPEQIYKDKTFTMDNYPKDINYADMSNDTPESKEYLLSLWNH